MPRDAGPNDAGPNDAGLPPPIPTRPEAEPAAVLSPCVKRCAIAPAYGVCVGCGRTLREIGGWSGYSDSTRAAVMALLPERLARLRAQDPGAFADDGDLPHPDACQD